MTISTFLVVGAGLVAALVLGIAAGIDATTGVMLVLLAGVGWLAVEVARRASRRDLEPATCGACGGLVSAHAPVCKHCGAPRGSPPRR